MILGPDGQPAERRDVTVNVSILRATGSNWTKSYVEWNMPDCISTRIWKILKDHGGQMHYFDFLAEYQRRYVNG